MVTHYDDISKAAHTGLCSADLGGGGFCRAQQSSEGMSQSVPPEKAEQSDQAGRDGAIGPLSSLQLRWQGSKANESGSSGGLLTQAARGKRSCEGLLSGRRQAGGGVAWGAGTFQMFPLPARFR